MTRKFLVSTVLLAMIAATPALAATPINESRPLAASGSVSIENIKGRILFEMEGVSEKEAREAFRLASSKLPMKVRFVKRFAEERVS